MGEIVPFIRQQQPSASLSQKIKEAIGDIQIQGRRVRTAQDRHEFLSSFAYGELHEKAYTIERNLQRLGKILPFTQTGSYDQPYILLDIQNGIYRIGDQNEVFDNMISMTERSYPDEQNFNSLSESLIFYGLTNKAFGSVDAFPTYMRRIIVCHQDSSSVTEAINNTFPVTEHKIFKDLNSYIDDEYSTTPRRIR